MGIIDEALAKGQGSLSEYQAKLFLREHNIPVTREVLVTSVLQTTAGRMIFSELKGGQPEKKVYGVNAR